MLFIFLHNLVLSDTCKSIKSAQKDFYSPGGLIGPQKHGYLKNISLCFCLAFPSGDCKAIKSISSTAYFIERLILLYFRQTQKRLCKIMLCFCLAFPSGVCKNCNCHVELGNYTLPELSSIKLISACPTFNARGGSYQLDFL